jgi:transposase-like protein
MAKIKERNSAIEMIKSGSSPTEISRILGVSRLTVGHWIRKYSKENGIGKSSILKSGAKESIGEISERDLMMVGLGLYIGQGSKKYDRVELKTADAKIAKVFTLWLNKGLGVPNENIYARLFLYPNHDIDRCRSFWSVTVGIGEERFKKPYVDMRKSVVNPKYTSAPMGSIQIYIKTNGKRAYGVVLHRKITAWMDSIVS